jgi:hypothetical protein
VSDPVHHVFNASANSTLAECLAICEQRGGEYEDSWHLDNLMVPFHAQVIRQIAHDQPYSREEQRLITMAAVCDVKLSRLAGPFKRDTYVDLINYVAALCSLLQDYLEKRLT